MSRFLKTLSFAFFLLTSFALKAQILEPVKWEFSASQSGDNEYILIIKATIDEGWKIYGMDIASGGPIPTTIHFEDSASIGFVDSLKQLGHMEGPTFEPLFNMDLTWWKHKAIFRQKVKVPATGQIVKGFVEFMTCDNKQCLPPTQIPFEFNLGKNNEEAVPGSDENKPEGGVDEINPAKKHSFWGYLIGGIGAGLIALLTPCVFPMIPLTVSFFTKRSTTRRKGFINALTYAMSIIVIFIGLGFFITGVFGPSALNAMASNVFFNMLFFALFFVFALSFFGVFEITLPSKWVNKSDVAADRGGLIGIFFMAFTLVLVSFSCTVPIVGSMLVIIAEKGEFWGPLFGMLGFALALAIPFALFAAFPSWLNSMPKSGGWLNTIKVSLGFLELALAFKFLSIVDLAYHWGFLKRDIFISIWIVIAVLWGFYLLGKIRFAHDGPSEHISVTRLFFAIIAFSIAVYMVPGLWGAPVRILSGIAPPQHYQEFNLNTLQYKIAKLESKIDALQAGGIAQKNHADDAQILNSIPVTVVDNMDCPHELNCFFDYAQGMAYARLHNKPVMLDFTGWTCVNCRKMEEYVWPDPAVWKILNDDYVLISLFVDDKTKLPADFGPSPYTGHEVSTVGGLWSDLQTTRYNINSQPYYVLIDHDGKELVTPRGYTPDVSEYISWLQSGIKTFAK